jgi:SAM-dependent methyltransferase
MIDDMLCCPVDKSYPLLVDEPDWRNGKLQSGILRCPTCNAEYPVISGIAYLLPPSGTQTTEIAEARRREAEARDADAAGYDATKPDYETSMERNEIVNALNIQPGEVILDLGAGTGRITTALAERGATVIAMDISAKSLELNRDKCSKIKNANVIYLVVDVCHLPLRDEVAHKAVSGQMLEHIQLEAERHRCIKEMRRVLRNPGRVVLTVYNYSLTKRRNNEREGYHQGGLYYYRFDRNELSALLNDHDFRVRNVTGLLNLPAGLQSAVLDKLVAQLPQLAGLSGDMLFAVADC